MNGLKVVAAIVVVILIGVVVWQYSPVEVETGTVRLCQSEHHQGDREISRDTEIKRVPRWRAGNYQITVATICDSCQAKIDAEKREAERQARIAREAADLGKRMDKAEQSIEAFVRFSDGSRECSVRPGEHISLVVFARCVSNEPIDAGKFRLEVSPGGSVGYHTTGFYSVRDRHDEWQQLIGPGLSIGTLNPTNSPYYESRNWMWPEESYGGKHRTYVRVSTQPGQDIRVTGFLVIDEFQIRLNTVTIHVMH